MLPSSEAKMPDFVTTLRRYVAIMQNDPSEARRLHAEGDAGRLCGNHAEALLRVVEAAHDYDRRLKVSGDDNNVGITALREALAALNKGA